MHCWVSILGGCGVDGDCLRHAVVRHLHVLLCLGKGGAWVVSQVMVVGCSLAIG